MRTRHSKIPQRLLHGIAACALPTAIAVGAPAHAQTAANGDAEAIVLRPLSFFKVNDLDFGSIIASNTAGTVRIAPDGTRSASGGAALAGGNAEPARFAGLGTYNRQVNIALSPHNIWITGPGQRMRVRDFEIGSTPTAILSTSPVRFRIGAPLGNYNFPVGATLYVNANQAPGDYSGTFTITLNYL
ncbi:DUF4402 domain-containing protein [Sphingopyxis indica]|uniref:DUF4402 domain-containing protein n=1 Tax=Sphingopyxis indica TaxID=436663 RepID=UPI002938F8BA|nr:DUF4402 domain-containing protein [Sphingopyxis indica]